MGASVAHSGRHSSFLSSDEAQQKLLLVLILWSAAPPVRPVISRHAPWVVTAAKCAKICMKQTFIQLWGTAGVAGRPNSYDGE